VYNISIYTTLISVILESLQFSENRIPIGDKLQESYNQDRFQFVS